MFNIKYHTPPNFIPFSDTVADCNYLFNDTTHDRKDVSCIKKCYSCKENFDILKENYAIVYGKQIRYYCFKCLSRCNIDAI